MFYAHSNRLSPLELRVVVMITAAFVLAFGVFAETTNSVNDVVENVLRSQLSSAPLPTKLGDSVTATSAIEKRKSILDELYQSTDDETIDVEHEISEMYTEAIRCLESIRKSLGQINKILEGIRKKRIYDEKELKETLESLDGIDMANPLAMAQHEIEELAPLDLSDMPLYYANMIKKEIGVLDSEVRRCDSKVNALKADLLIRRS